MKSLFSAVCLFGVKIALAIIKFYDSNIYRTKRRTYQKAM